jgi:glycosyltransferase involved in cell wall biosynthesis
MTSTNSRPLISCIVTAFNEGELASISIESLLNQSFKNFEIVIVDDGADEATRNCLSRFKDPRIKYLRQANDGLSSARNRGMKHCSGDYVCFLDADDIRPNWAFERLAVEIERSNPDCIFMSGMLSDLRKEMVDFYDAEVLRHIAGLNMGKRHFKRGEPLFNLALEAAFLIEPQSANKLIRRQLIQDSFLTFPNGMYYEDMLFHIATICSCTSFSVEEQPMFTYFRRYGRPQITSGNGVNRFDAISVARMTFEFFSQTPKFHRAALRMALMLSLFKLIKWCEESISHLHRDQYRQGVRLMATSLHPLYVDALRHQDKINDLTALAPWAPGVIEYIRKVTRDVPVKTSA